MKITSVLYLILLWVAITIPTFAYPNVKHEICAVEMETVHETHHAGDKSHMYRSSLMNAAVCFHTQDHITEAMQFYDHLRETFPDYAFVLVNIAVISLKNGDPRKVIELVNLYFDHVGGIYGEDNIELIDKDSQDIGPPCRTNARYREECVNALNFIASAYMELLNYANALHYYNRAISIGEGVNLISDIHTNIGGLFSRMGDYQNAADSFLRAFWVSIHSGNKLDPSALVRRAILVPSILIGLEDAVDVQNLFINRINDVLNLVEFGGANWEDDSNDMFRVKAGISTWEEIRAIPPLAQTLTDWANRIQTPHFYLHYCGFHDRPIQELVAEMYKKISHPSLNQISTSLNNYDSSNLVSREMYPSIEKYYSDEIRYIDHEGEREPKIRIAFISSHFGGNEPHGLLLVDVMRRLPSEKFECIAIGIGSTQPGEDFIDSVSGNYYGVGRNDAYAIKLLSSLALDCVVFAESMNEALIYFLAFQRFAPVQVLVMGAPVSSGIPSIDYFISGDRLEHPFRTQMSGDLNHLEHYSEQVVLFDGQAISFPRDESHPRQDDNLAAGDAIKVTSVVDSQDITEFDKYGIPIGNFAIYMIFQNAFKIHPIFDSVILNIMHADTNGHFVLQASRDSLKTELLICRIRDSIKHKLCHNPLELCSSAQKILSRVHFIPRVRSDKLKAVLQRSTVILHPFPFGGSKTASDAFNAGIPLVTYPQKYLRGRMASSFYTTMALHEIDSEISASSCCVASDVSDYVSKVLRLGQDKSYRYKVSKAILARKDRIFDDRQTSFEWARFLTRALGVNVNKNDLALDMEYAPDSWQQDDFLEQEICKAQRQWKTSKLIASFLV